MRINIWQKYPKLTLINPLWFVAIYIRNPIMWLISDVKEIYFSNKPRFYCSEDMEEIGVPVEDVKGWSKDKIALWLLSNIDDFVYELGEIKKKKKERKYEFEWVNRFEELRDNMFEDVWEIEFPDNKYLKITRKIKCWKMETC